MFFCRINVRTSRGKVLLSVNGNGKGPGRALKAIYTCLMLAAAALVIGGKVPSIGAWFVAAEPAGTHVGDLYRLCGVDRFREPIRAQASCRNTPLRQAEILTLGDSFFNSALDSDLFANVLAEKSGHAVHNLPADGFFEPFSYPLAYLEHIGYRPDRRRILILEAVERSSLERTSSFNARAGSSSNRLDGLAFKVLKNSDVEYFFKNNLVTRPAISWLKNLRFDWFGIVDGAIGAYTLNPDMLFYRRDLDFAAQPKPDSVLDGAADRVAQLSATLRTRYGLDLLLVIIPDKYSVYREQAGADDPYDRYIPRLVERLRKRGVHSVDLYTAYLISLRAGKEPLYYMSDSHYTPLGKSILVDECLREMAAMKVMDPTEAAGMRRGQRTP